MSRKVSGFFNINSNWITDVCQPGLNQEQRFLHDGAVTRPRDRVEQGRDCPPEFSWPYEWRGRHACPYQPPCKHATIKPAIYILSPVATSFIPSPRSNHLPALTGETPLDTMPVAVPGDAVEIDRSPDEYLQPTAAPGSGGTAE